MKFQLVMALAASSSGIQLMVEDIPGREKGDNHDNSLTEK